MAGTLTPTPYQTVLDADGVAVSGAKITTTDTGTGVAAATYTNAALSAANTNPIVADSAGRYVAYLPAGANFTFAITTSAGAAIETQTNIQAVPGSSVNLDIEGTVGVAVTAGQVLYLSSAAESPALTAGKWYLTDSDVAATSTTPQSIGVAVSAIAINTAGTIRLAGEVNSAGTVVVGTTYYVGATPGAIVSSAPVLSRQVGVGLTTSSLLLAATTAVVGALPNPITQDLLFTDNTYDIGKSGASRPRDGFFSRNAVVGGTLSVSSTDASSLDVSGGLNIGSGNVALVGTDGKLSGPLSSTIIDDLSGANLTTLNASNVSSGTLSEARLPAGISVAKGGTGVATLTANSLLLGAGTSDVTFAAPGTSGNVLTSNGTVWASAAPATITSLDTGTVAYAGRTITVDTGGVLNIVLASSAGDDFTVDTSKFVVSGDTGYIGLGTAAPDSPIHILSADDQLGHFKSSDGTTYIRIGDNAGSTTLGTVGGDLRIGVGGSTIASPSLTVSSAGNVSITGSLSKGSGSFKIDHPLPAKNATHHLIHSFLESPRAGLVYYGSTTLVDGSATVDLDADTGMSAGTWVLLCRDEQVYTSNESGFAAVRGSVSGSTLTIECEEGTCDDTVSWMVVAERQDQHILETSWTDEDGRPILEPLKPPDPPDPEEDDDDDDPA
jgi:hypothetical protein